MNQENHNKQAYTLNEFCQLYSIGRTKAYEEINQGRLKVVKIGKKTLITATSANDWIESLGNGGQNND